jgi:hypothetical protein
MYWMWMLFAHIEHLLIELLKGIWSDVFWP